MKLSRQQEREMYRRLNDPAKMKVVLKQIDNKQNRIDAEKKLRKRVRLVRIVVCTILAGIASLLLYAFG